VKFWDSSAVVPLLVHEAATPFFRSVYARDPLMTVWWGTAIECASALARYERDPRIAANKAIADGFRRLNDAAAHWNEIAASASVKEAALVLLRRHALRAADALQLAAAVIAREEKGAAWEFVCADTHLLQAAIREGFEVLAPATA
jgi:uncharacterized protein